jgi:hypothetical protein
MAALLAADTNLEILAHFPAMRNCHFHQLAEALRVQDFERVILQNSRVVVHRQEFVLGVFT